MKYKTVIEKFDSHFRTKSNITFLRFKFFNVKQQENQPVDDFVNELRTKAQECEFLELTESLIRDRIVCGINNLKLQERLLREPDLTLDRTILLCKLMKMLENKQLKFKSIQVLQKVRLMLLKQSTKVKSNLLSLNLHTRNNQYSRVHLKQ